MDDGIDFKFINEVALKVANFFYDDPDREKLCLEVIHYYYQNDDFPEGTIQKINDFLIDTNDKDYLKLVDDVNFITAEEENIYNLLSAIFFQSIDDDYNYKDQNVLIVDEEEEEEVHEENNNSNSQSYFNRIITELIHCIPISYDIAYVLLNKYFWNKDKIIQDFFSAKQDKMLNSIHIKINSEMVPSLQSPLSMKKVGNGECPFCLDQKNLYKLYCGHVLCKKCIRAEIIQHIKENNVAVCRQNCNAEIMPHDVKKFLTNDEFEKYQKIVFQKEIALNPDVKMCPNENCNGIITPLNALPCHVGRCPQCYSVTCLRCHRGAHAPIDRCELIDEFTKISEQMAQLQQDQEAWFKREKELQSYRREHLYEVKMFFDHELRSFMELLNSQMKREQSRIDKVSKELSDLQDKMTNLKKKRIQLLNEDRLSKEIEEIDKELQSLHDMFNQKDGYEKFLQKEKSINDFERKNEIETFEKEEKLFIDAIKDPSMYQYKMYEFEKSVNIRAYQNANLTINDDDFILMITKKCPKCHTPIMRNGGSNQITCQICSCKFCYVCGELWETHSNYFTCPNYKKDIVITNKKGKSQCGIDFNDKNDKKFYPPPISVEKKSRFIRWNNLNDKFKIQKEKYDNLFKELNDKESYMKNKHICAYNEKNTPSKIINTLLFAQSVVMYGTISAFFIHDLKRASIFEYKISIIEENKNKLLDLIRVVGLDEDLKHHYDILTRSILDVLDIPFF